MVEKIWFKDIAGLFTEQNFNKFFPSKDMTFAEQLNSLVRMAFYFSIISFALQQKAVVFMIPVFMCGFTYFLYMSDSQNKTATRDYFKQQSLSKDPYSEEVCSLPTRENPFMNVLMSEYSSDPERKKACNISSNPIKKQTQKHFDRKLYRSVSDIFNKEASDRQWITNPITTIPNDQESFAKWCWGGSKTCKEGDGHRCYSNSYRQVKT